MNSIVHSFGSAALSALALLACVSGASAQSAGSPAAGESQEALARARAQAAPSNGTDAQASSCAACVVPIPITTLPTTISSPGYYCLSHNLSLASGDFGIEVTATNVVVDLNGFALLTSEAQTGIVVRNSGVLVCNGRISGWRTAGVLFEDNDGAVRDLRVQFCGQGIRALLSLEVTDCLVQFSTGTGNGNGIDVGFVSRIRRSTVNTVDGVGIRTGSFSVVEDCLVRATGLQGIDVGTGGRISGCTLDLVGGNGIVLGRGGSVSRCSLTSVGQAGIVTEDSCTVEDCRIVGAETTGFDLGSYSRAQNCIVNIAKENGYYLRPGSSAERCTAANVDVDGFQSSGGSNTVRECTVHRCGRTGIFVKGVSVVEGNSLAECTVEGILVQGEGSRVEGNHVVASGAGVRILSGLDNLVISNSAEGSLAPYQFLSNNTVGPIGTMQDWIHASNPYLNFHLDF